MGLSSNILWHQTSKNGLLNIIKQKKFRYSYSLESIKVSGENEPLELAFPMISFCDFAIEDIGNYITRYGNYTIGLSRDWGFSNGINPVWYCNENVKILHKLLSCETNRCNEMKLIYELLSYVKNYNGELLKRKFKDYRFYDEREMRFTLEYDYMYRLGLEPFIREKFRYDSYKEKHNKSSLLNIGIDFNYSDIRYIIAQNDKDIIDFKELIGVDYNINYFTIDQIRNDFIGDNHNKKTNKKKTNIVGRIDLNKKTPSKLVHI